MSTPQTATTRVRKAPKHAINGSISPATDADARPPSAMSSRFLPTSREAVLFTSYPIVLLLGSLYSTLQHASLQASYSHTTQSYDVRDAPSYFAKKSNVFNVYFVKIGWFWFTLAFLLLIISHHSFGPPFRLHFTKARRQALARYGVLTATWFAVTQWFFGPAIIDRSFRWTGGRCAEVQNLGSELLAAKAVNGDIESVLTHAACKAIGGQWSGGHDISGHVFLLVLGSAMLCLELLGAISRQRGVLDDSVRTTQPGLKRDAAISELQGQGYGGISIGVQVALAVAGLSGWMLLMTAVFFHTWFEKVTGLLVAFVTIYTVYVLPRVLPLWRTVIGIPGA